MVTTDAQIDHEAIDRADHNGAALTNHESVDGIDHKKVQFVSITGCRLDRS